MQVNYLTTYSRRLYVVTPCATLYPHVASKMYICMFVCIYVANLQNCSHEILKMQTCMVYVLVLGTAIQLLNTSQIVGSHIRDESIVVVVVAIFSNYS